MPSMMLISLASDAINCPSECFNLMSCPCNTCCQHLVVPCHSWGLNSFGVDSFGGGGLC